MPQVSFGQLVAKVRSGKHLASFPTDTVPALAARPDRAALIFEAKQRSLDKPLILMAADMDDLWLYVTGKPQEQRIWQQVAERYWPGALTLVLPASDRVPAALNPKDPTTIAVRVPDHAIAQAILTQTGPLATTSANRSGQPALQTMTEIESQFPQVLTLSPEALQILEPNHQPGTGTRRQGNQGETRTGEHEDTEIMENVPASPRPHLSGSSCHSSQSSGVPSTIARWTGQGWEILRQGGVVLDD